MSKRFLIIMAALFVLFIGVVVFTKNQKSSDKTTQSDNSSAESQHVIGAGNKKVTIIEYADFQCPACKSYYPVVKQVKEKYGDDIKFQFRNFPLVQIHQNAMVAHRAAEAAGRQGKFWEMHDILYERQTVWGSSTNATAIMEDYAAELALNNDQYKTDFASEATNKTIAADVKAGQSIGVNSTPTFLINGKKIEKAPNDLAGFSKLIDEAMQK